MRRADGGGADGGATAAELGAGNDCIPGLRACRCFVVGGLPHVAGNIGPSREEAATATPQSEPDNEFERNFGWRQSLLDQGPFQGHRGASKVQSFRVICVLEGGGHTHPQRPPFKPAMVCSTRVFLSCFAVRTFRGKWREPLITYNPKTAGRGGAPLDLTGNTRIEGALLGFKKRRPPRCPAFLLLFVACCSTSPR